MAAIIEHGYKFLLLIARLGPHPKKLGHRFQATRQG